MIDEAQRAPKAFAPLSAWSLEYDCISPGSDEGAVATIAVMMQTKPRNKEDRQAADKGRDNELPNWLRNLRFCEEGIV